MEEKKSKSKTNNKLIKILLPIFLIIAIALLICAIIFAPKLKEAQTQNKMERSLIGTWTTDGYTIYSFEKNGRGALKLPTEEYPFKYIIHTNKLYIDFENEKSMDLNYEYSFDENGKLVLKGIKESFGVYVFNRVEE